MLGRFPASGSASGTEESWDAQSGNERTTIHAAGGVRPAFRPDRKTPVPGRKGGQIRLRGIRMALWQWPPRFGNSALLGKAIWQILDITGCNLVRAGLE